MAFNRRFYLWYIAESEQWQEKRKQIWNRAITHNDGQCEICHGKYGPPSDLHHRTYKNLGNERPEDLLLLCRPCHETISLRRSSGPSISEMWKMLAEMDPVKLGIIEKKREPPA